MRRRESKPFLEVIMQLFPFLIFSEMSWENWMKLKTLIEENSLVNFYLSPSFLGLRVLYLYVYIKTKIFKTYLAWAAAKDMEVSSDRLSTG